MKSWSGSYMLLSVLNEFLKTHILPRRHMVSLLFSDFVGTVRDTRCRHCSSPTRRIAIRPGIFGRPGVEKASPNLHHIQKASLAEDFQAGSLTRRPTWVLNISIKTSSFRSNLCFASRLAPVWYIIVYAEFEVHKRLIISSDPAFKSGHLNGTKFNRLIRCFNKWVHWI